MTDEVRDQLLRELEQQLRVQVGGYWADKLKALLPPEPPSKSWQTMCPDCDHGIRGGAPCETCNGEGSVSVVFASER